MYFIKKTVKEDLEQMRKDYSANLTAPMDDMWEEGIIPSGDFFTIKQDDTTVGYFVLDGEGVMMAFYVKEKTEVNEIFKFVVERKNVTKAYVFTGPLQVLCKL